MQIYEIRNMSEDQGQRNSAIPWGQNGHKNTKSKKNGNENTQSVLSHIVLIKW